MKIAVFGPERRVAAVDGERLVDLNIACAKLLTETSDEPLPYAMASALAPADLASFIESGPRALDSARKAIEYLSSKAGDHLGPKGETIVHPLGSVKLHPPLASRGSRIMTSGGNFADHVQRTQSRRFGKEQTVQQLAEESRARPIWGFWKIPLNTVGHEDAVTYPARTKLLDYEGEVALVLGKRVKDVSEAAAPSFFWGFTLHNDWSARDQQDPAPYNFALGKNFDSSSSLGPWIETDIKDAQDIPFETHVSGERRQSGSTRDMIFSFAEYISYLSRDMTLLPGDILSGGTCAGTAMDSSEYDSDGKPSPKLFAKPGDVVEVSSPLIGTLRNAVVAKG